MEREDALRGEMRRGGVLMAMWCGPLLAMSLHAELETWHLAGRCCVIQFGDLCTQFQLNTVLILRLQQTLFSLP